MTGGRYGWHGGATWLVGVAVGALLLGACTKDHPPPVPPTTSASSPKTAQPSATASPPTAPKAAPTQKSAEAFVRYFWDVHNYSYATLNTALFKSISESDCTFCSSTEHDISNIKGAGSVSIGSAVKIITLAAPPSKIVTGIIVSTVITQQAGRVTRSDGSSSVIPAMRKTQSYVSLNWTGQKWLVDDVAIDNSGKKS